MHHLLNNQRGFTYMEVMLSLTIFSFVLTSGFYFYSNNQKLIEHEVEEAEVQMHARTLLNRTSLELSYGKNLDWTDNMIVSVNADGSFIPVIDNSGYTYRGRINILRDTDGLKVVNEKGQLISDKLKDFRIEIDGDTFTITITAEHRKKIIEFKKKFYKHKL